MVDCLNIEWAYHTFVILLHVICIVVLRHHDNSHLSDRHIMAKNKNI